MRASQEGVLRAARLVAAFAIVVALSFQFRHSVDGRFEAVNFFSFFTVLSNVLAAALLVWESIWRPPAGHGPRAASVRGAVTLYMCITGLVYAVLLAPADVGKPEPWVDFVIHVAGPVVLFLDWMLDPPRRLPGRSVILLWLAWPVVYVVYSLVRGDATGWYPYPFLDPDESGGYPGVAGYAAGILATFVGVGLVLHWWASRTAEPAPLLGQT